MEHTVHNKLLRISSFYKNEQSNSNSDFSLSYDVKEIQNTIAIVVKHVSFPNVFYNVNALNNVFAFFNGVTVKTVSLPIGQYNMSKFLTDLNALLAADGLTITQSTLTNKLTITNTSGSNVTVYFDHLNSMYKLLGLSENANILNTSSYNLLNLPALQGIQHVYINSASLSKANNMVSPNTVQVTSSVVMVPVNVPFGQNVHYETQHEELDLINYDGVKDLSSIDIKLLDIEGNILDLNGHNFTMILKAYYELQP